ncbi:hypothetical protein Arub01_40280 [Actinomadura rubrobrunea]|uniref:Uncharacterized protein n=1 Tax=Actinomadura rubrobrunea TaxID=115335 RepID=A0A9W6PZB6_9ACTN|nr:hypothetical protein [Actinomadura rubrobrunea]GLW65784.1 hypothetical protein Arub01_40280 [Actinomadura rubrobrunea]
MEERLRLQLMLMHVQTLSDEHWHVFTGPLRAMGDHAWVGGESAKAFGQELERSDRELHAQLRKALELVQDKLRRPPL